MSIKPDLQAKSSIFATLPHPLLNHILKFAGSDENERVLAAVNKNLNVLARNIFVNQLDNLQDILVRENLLEGGQKKAYAALPEALCTLKDYHQYFAEIAIKVIKFSESRFLNQGHYPSYLMYMAVSVASSYSGISCGEKLALEILVQSAKMGKTVGFGNGQAYSSKSIMAERLPVHLDFPLQHLSDGILSDSPFKALYLAERMTDCPDRDRVFFGIAKYFLKEKKVEKAFFLLNRINTKYCILIAVNLLVEKGFVKEAEEYLRQKIPLIISTQDLKEFVVEMYRLKDKNASSIVEKYFCEIVLEWLKKENAKEIIQLLSRFKTEQIGRLVIQTLTKQGKLDIANQIRESDIRLRNV